MTAQIHDRILFHDRELEIVTIDGGPLPSPMDFGMFPRPLHTACWRGYHNRYRMDEEGFLVLESMVVGNCENGWKTVNGKKPSVDEGTSRAEYTEIGFRTSFTGRLQAAADFIDSKYVHMGFHPASAYETVLELEVEDGKLVSVQDLSCENRKQRTSDGPIKGADLMDWIKKRFSMDPSIKGVRRKDD
ncbi:MAG: hypothetical protein GF388_08375 [Candidatus Aegiribacteria sp.]|nr:hypothetical protein [Candidatus Aegiribacteria sp.]MBD3295101.1 hypothetical protein [Candidatus Fermentibacteria bacterium]